MRWRMSQRQDNEPTTKLYERKEQDANSSEITDI